MGLFKKNIYSTATLLSKLKPKSLRRVSKVRFLGLLSIAITISLATITILSSPPVYADPQDNREECEAAGGTWNPILPFKNCSGFTLPELDWTPTQRATQWSYLNAIQRCVRDAKTTDRGWNGDSNHINDSHAKSGEWFFDGSGYRAAPTKVAGSYLASDVEDDGNIKCSSLLPQAYSIWEPQFGSYLNLLCSFVNVRDNGSSCETGNGDFVNISIHDGSFYGSIQDEVWLGNSRSATDAGYYVLYSEAFFKGCKAKENPDASGKFKYSVKLVNEDGTINEKVYEGLEQDHEIKTYTTEGLNTLVSKCSFVADQVNAKSSAYAQWIADNPDKKDTPPEASTRPGGDGTEETTSCAVDGIGWIICPLSDSIAKGVDNVYNLVEYFLRVEPLSFNTKSGLYNAWSAMRNLANVAFVLAFLAIIYSQTTGAGLTNYGIKKMLPKLVVAAILVNTSYIICALLVDVSNIAGSSLQQLFVTIRDNAASTTPTDIPTWDIFITSVLSGGTLGGLAFVGLGAAGSFTALLWLAVPVLIAALFSVLMAVLVLAGRQALIIILITLAPLAFVAYLLPNTQKLFDKWKDIFVTLLIMYPILSVIFGGSQLAASIIMNNADNTVMVLLALVVQVIPLAITPLVIKFSGGFLNRVAGIVNNSQKGLLDKGKNYARERAALSTKKGLASKTPNLLNRMGQRRDFGVRRRKALGEKYDAQANEGWLKSDTGRSHERDLSDAKLNEETARTRVNAFATANRSKQDALASHVAKQELEMHTKIENAEFEELKVNDLSVDNSNLGDLAREARNNLRETNVASSRATAAGRVQQQEEATEIGKTTERHNPLTGQMETVQSALAQRMGGVDPNGTSRAVASATAALDKQWGENVSAEKTTMSSMSVEDIMATMKDTSISAERRAAAAGMVMARGGDQHVQATLDYLGTADRSADPDIANVQKQVAHDIGGRKPFALGETDVSTLANGTYGLDKNGNPANGAFNDKLLGRIQAGKLGTNELLSMGTDELQRVTELAASGKLNDAEHSQISAAIEAIYTNDNITNPNDEKTALLRSVQARKPGKLTKLEPIVPPTKSARPYGPVPPPPTP